MHRRALDVASRYFERDGGAAAYVLGDPTLIGRMAASWKVLSGAVDLPENAPAISTRDYYEIQWLKAGGKRE